VAVRIREFKMGDYGKVRRLWALCGLDIRPGDEKEDVRVKVTRDPELFLVAEDGRKIVGSVIGAWDGRRGWLYHLGVLPKSQRKGLATALVREAEKRMRAKGVAKVNAHVLETNLPSRALFEKEGYKADASILFYGKFLRAGRWAGPKKR
jgi:ribosomal protein S18 acetylase RimI-like enzyme